MKRPVSFWLTSLCILALSGPVSAQLRIVDYNTANGTFPSGNNHLPRTGMDNVLQAIGDEVTNGISRPIDVLILQEQDDPDTTTQAFVDLLDGLYGAGTYAHSTVITQPSYSTNIRQTLVYNTNTVDLVGEKAFGATGSSFAARQSSRYQLRPVGYDSSADFYIYNDHYKSSQGSTEEARRNYEANTVRNDADALGQGAHIIYAGDFNMYSSSEPAYQTLLSSGNGQAFDPINTPGSWHNNYSYRAVHTQSPHDYSDGLVGGGIDDRFDFQLVTGEMLDNEGMSYISGSYHAFGNNGTTYNKSVNASSNTYPVSQSILDDLAHVSDHLPVVADYQLPAKMQVDLGSTVPNALVGASLGVPVTVTNAAPVQVAIGADELDYNVTTTGSLSGSASGTANPLATGNVHSLSVDTSSAGFVSGAVNVNATSQNTSDGTFAQNVYAVILDHAEASFASGTDQDLLTIDFGTLTMGSGVIDIMYDLFNLEQTAGYTAGLALDSILASGDVGTLTTDAATFTDLAAGSSNTFTASFDTSAAGLFSSTYELSVSDGSLLGSLSGNTLTLQLLGEVTSALTGDLDGDGFVGILDLNIVLGAWNQSVPPAGTMTDPSGDGYVGIEDLNIVLGNWNAGTPPTSAVPEPGMAVMLGLSGLALLRRRRTA